MSRVSIIKCSSYNTGNVADAVSRAVGLVGGIKGFVKEGERVLIKPNLISARDPDEAVCTHPEVVRAAVRLVKKAGGRPLIGDSPGSFFTIEDIDHVYEKTGIKSVALEEGAQLLRFEKSRMVNGYAIAEEVFKAASVISLPKLKTHMLAGMTGAVKNTYGMVPGLHKVECHRRMPKIRDFAKIILDVFEITKPRLSIMDGIVGMEGDGPTSGKPRKLGLILASPDAVSLDAVVSHLVRLPFQKDVMLNEARRRGAGETNLDKVEILGEKIDSIGIKGFRLPITIRGMLAVPDFAAEFIMKAVDFRPFIDEKKCKKCGICKNSCPVDVITINEDVSRIDNKGCIKCFCCHEVCPYKAVYVKRNLFTKLLWRN
ncbi:MAG: DUF362 domain-containing protein [Candidatus Omnitrophica bacterium]|nr:DUF362 domain-containing protein [Candidatus Omnitrophota bacterium]